MSADFDKEQEEIIETIGKLLEPCTGKDKEGQRWGKFKGDVVCRVLATYIQNRLPSGLKVVGPSVYVAGFKFPWEFDLAIVSREARPRQYTNAYDGQQIRSILEIKKFGTIAKGSEFKEKVRARITEPFNRVTQEYPQIRPAYLAIRETVNPVKPDSIKYAKLTREALSPYPDFILQDARTGAPQVGRWEALIEYLVKK
jgi:hypothetical protein